ncbi:protein of unknown function [Burkholderia multivorans]
MAGDAATAPARLSPKLCVARTRIAGLHKTLFFYTVSAFVVCPAVSNPAHPYQTLLIIAKDDSWKKARKAPG